MVATLPKEYYELKNKQHTETHLEIAAICARGAYWNDRQELLELAQWFAKEACTNLIVLTE